VPLRSLTTKLGIIGCNAYFLRGNFYAESTPVILPGQAHRPDLSGLIFAEERNSPFTFVAFNRDNRSTTSSNAQSTD